MKLSHKLINLLQHTMEEPQSFGLFHLLCIGLMIGVIVYLYCIREKHSEKQLKIVLGVYGITVLLLETLKQISWAITIDTTSQTITWDYEWYAFPFQLCTTPMFASIICLFLRKNKFREYLLSYMAFVTILGSIAVIFYPDSCLVENTLANIHTMWLHLGSFVVSIYLLMSKEIKASTKVWSQAIPVFLSFALIANILNVCLYQTGVLHGETFNMFYISPYFESILPVFDIIQRNTSYPIFLTAYVIAIIFMSFIILQIAKITSACSRYHSQKQKIKVNQT